MFERNDASVLNGLISTTVDSIHGYREAADDVSDARFKSMFMNMADERDGALDGLRAAVTAAGGTPETDGTVLAAAHRVFVDLKARITGRDEKAIIDEVERGEDHIKAKFEEALADDSLSAEARAAVEKAYASVRKGHDAMRDLKHGMERAGA